MCACVLYVTGQKLHTLSLPAGEVFCGVTTVKDKIFVLSSKLNRGMSRIVEKQIRMYNANGFTFCSQIDLPADCDYWGARGDIVSCAYYNCLYVSDARCVAKITIIGMPEQFLFTKWPTENELTNLSVTEQHTVLASCMLVRTIKEYTTDGTLLREVRLPQPVGYPLQAIQVAGCNNSFVVCCGGLGANYLCQIAIIDNIRPIPPETESGSPPSPAVNSNTTNSAGAVVFNATRSSVAGTSGTAAVSAAWSSVAGFSGTRQHIPPTVTVVTAGLIAGSVAPQLLASTSRNFRILPTATVAGPVNSAIATLSFARSSTGSHVLRPANIAACSCNACQTSRYATTVISANTHSLSTQSSSVHTAQTPACISTFVHNVPLDPLGSWCHMSQVLTDCMLVADLSNQRVVLLWPCDSTSTRVLAEDSTDWFPLRVHYSASKKQVLVLESEKKPPGSDEQQYRIVAYAI